MKFSKTLVNLAILETLKAGEKKGEIDLFVPYVAISIGNLREIPFVAEGLQEQSKIDFGIGALLAAVVVLMARAKNRKLISKKVNLI